MKKRKEFISAPFPGFSQAAVFKEYPRNPLAELTHRKLIYMQHLI
jgi:hypothetical protein